MMTSILTSVAHTSANAQLIVDAGIVDALVGALAQHDPTSDTFKKSLALFEHLTAKAADQFIAHGGTDAVLSLMRTHKGNAGVESTCVKVLERTNVFKTLVWKTCLPRWWGRRTRFAAASKG